MLPFAVEPHNLREEGLCNGFRRVRVRQGDEMGVLAEPVDDGEYDGLAADTGQGFDEVHPQVAPDCGGDWKREKQPGGL